MGTYDTTITKVNAEVKRIQGYIDLINDLTVSELKPESWMVLS